MAETLPRATVVIPAHDEERGLGRLLPQVVPPGEGRLRVVVVANGCTDRTADVARSCGVDVVELPEGNKQRAMRSGADLADRRLPLVLLDADVVMSAEDLLALVDAVDRPGVEAAAPRRVLDLGRSSWAVRSYYAVWAALPQVGSGLFGRGVIALSPVGWARVEALPHFVSDDLAVSESFAAAERVVVDRAEVVVVAPRRLGDLVRRRRRVVLGNREYDSMVAGRERTSLRSVLGLLRTRPGLAPHLPVFVGVTAVARLGARGRSAASEVWHRDASSRES